MKRVRFKHLSGHPSVHIDHTTHRTDMTIIYGWTGKIPSSGEPGATLSAMHTALGVLPRRMLHTTFVDTHFSMGAVAIEECTASYHKDGLFVFLAGSVTDRYRIRGGIESILEKLVEAYRNRGACCFDLLDGAFSAMLHDSHAEKTLLAVDRAGIARLCYCVEDQGVLFSSSVTSLIAGKTKKATFHHQALYDYLYFHMVPAPDTLYEGIHKILPGQCITISKSGIHDTFYWKMPYREDSADKLPTLAKRFRSTLSSTLEPYLEDTETACFLSGGTDSSTLAGFYAHAAQRQVRTYSIGFNIPDYDETPYARIAAEHFATQHTVYYLTPNDVLDAIPKIAAAYDEPFGNASAIPAYYCAKVAAQDGISTLIGGDGGDELFAGNARYAKQRLFEHYTRLPEWLKTGLIRYIASNTSMQTLPVIRKLVSYLNQARIPLPDRLESYNFLHHDAADTILTPDYIQHINQNKPLELQRAAYHRTDSPHSLNKMMHLDLKFTLADNDIRKVQTMCHLAGVDVTFPFLDRKMMEFAAGVPVTMQLKGQYLRYFFKTALKDFLPKEIIKKSKHGFGLPFGIWMTEYEPLHELARDSLSMLAKRNIVREDYIKQLWVRHARSDSAYYGVMIWILMMLEQWLHHHE